jgi:hypothetical protein
VRSPTPRGFSRIRRRLLRAWYGQIFGFHRDPRGVTHVDCNGCCTQNRGYADALIDIESFNDARWGLPDGRIQWADLGPTKGGGCQ